MYTNANMDVWCGRKDNEEETPSLRWHQVIWQWDAETDDIVEIEDKVALIGFASDEGVKRNKGRPGAIEGPLAIRSALANQAIVEGQMLIDAGDVVCDDEHLEPSQQELAQIITYILDANAFPLVMGGGHEVAWASFIGIHSYINEQVPREKTKLGIINFDAHLDLRNPEPHASSGTPFRQIAEHCESAGEPFNYCVVGFNPCVNTKALTQFANENGVVCIEDADCHIGNQAEVKAKLKDYISKLDCLYLTICLDVFSAAYAPGVSAPAALGLEPAFVIQMIRFIKKECKEQGVNILLADIAEMNPKYDRDGITAKLAARLVHEIIQD